MKVELQNLTKIFPSRNKKSGEEVVAVNNFTFTIPDGKLVGLLGPSGCGKSTTLYMISGLQKPSAGKIFFGEEDVTDLAPENTKDQMLERAHEAARLVQIDELMDRKPSELSGGQQQRVAIARALVKMPRVLLLDEPLSNLDARLRLQTREEIRRIQKETGITTVFVTHDQEEAMSISDMIVVMKLGVVQQVGKPQEIYDNPTNLFVAKFLGTPPINVFKGYVSEEKLFIGEQAVLDVKGVENREVIVAIRPEGFIVNDNGAFACNLSNVEVMGRDVSVVASHKNAESPIVRAILPSDMKLSMASGAIRFSVKREKLLVFDKATEERILI